MSCLQRSTRRETRDARTMCQLASASMFVCCVARPQFRTQGGWARAHSRSSGGPWKGVMPGHVNSQWSRVAGGPWHQVHGNDRVESSGCWLSRYSSRMAPRVATRSAAYVALFCWVPKARMSLAVVSACMLAPCVSISVRRRDALWRSCSPLVSNPVPELAFSRHPRDGFTLSVLESGVAWPR